MGNASIIFETKGNWDRLSSLPQPYNSWGSPYDPGNSACIWNKAKMKINLNYFVTKALLNYVQGPAAKIGACKVGSGVYAAQKKLDDNSSEQLLVHLTKTNGMFHAAIVNSETGRYSPVPTIGRSTNMDMSPIMLLVMLVLMEDSAEKIFPGSDACSTQYPYRSMSFQEVVQRCKKEYDATGELPKMETFMVNEAVYYALKMERESGFKMKLNGGNPEFLTQDRVDAGGCSGRVICGRPDILVRSNGNVSGGSYEGFNVKTAKDLFAAYTQTLSWSEEEEALIPMFDDDFPVPPETMMFADRFIRSRNKRLPMNNFLWRGITAYGKSTGVEIMACILHTPYVAVTCSSTMEKNDFLSQFVPNSALAAPSRLLPSFEEIAADPESAYEQITGVFKEGVTCDDALEAYGKAAAANAGGSHFKLVESDYVKALTRGWLVEIQEISRIKDPGVLVGLNAFDKPNSVIPLVDGRHERRHPNAIVFYTDNVGYVSCRPVDASVVRRVAFVVDSYVMPKERVLDRVKFNTEYANESILEKMYDVWEATSTYCKEQEITEGSVSVTELERWVSVVAMDGLSTFRDSFRQCVAAKATSDYETQEEIVNAMEPKLALVV